MFSLNLPTDVEDGQISDSPKTGSNLAMVRTNEEGDLFGNVGMSEVDESTAEDLRITEVSISMEPRFKEHLTEGYHRDKKMRHINQRIEKNPRLQDPYFWNVQEERLYFLSDGNRRLCIPAGPLRLELLKPSMSRCSIFGSPRPRSNLLPPGSIISHVSVRQEIRSVL